ncbi:heat shock 70 kDa protein 12B-like [Saccostrea cucullata]|uniref:heat shock 70 kDa protein 12B-like n=1 Tax=Saccostrea cuccullata TaxID=36930 RepID=UPI002ED61915
MNSTKTTPSLTSNKHSHLEKIPTVLLLDKDLQIHSFGHKAREEYTHLRGQKEAEEVFYFENFMTLIYEASTKSMDRSIQIPDAKGRNVSAEIIISRCASYMIERAIRHIREEFAHVLLSNFMFVFTLTTFWSLGDEFFQDALSDVNNKTYINSSLFLKQLF